MRINLKCGPVVQEEMSFKGEVYLRGMTEARQRPITIDHLEHLAQVS